MLFITSRGYSRILKPTKQRCFKGKIYGFDIETANDNKDFVCASVYLDDNNHWFFTDKDALINFFKTKRFHNSVVCATNLSFDFFGLFFQSEEVKQFQTLFRGSDLLYAKTYIKGKEFCSKSYVRDKNGKRVGKQGERLIFLDTLNYCKMSVESLGNILNVHKLKKPDFLGDHPRNVEEWNELKAYNIQDSKVSKMYIEFLYDAFEELGATPKNTIASTSMSLFKNKYLKHEGYFVHDTDELLEQFNAYYGGRTEALKRGKIENYNYYDFNSLYPSVMRYAYPDPNSKRVSRKNTCDFINNYDGVAHVDVWCPQMKYPLLPVKTKDKLIFGIGSFSGWYSNVELRRAMELGYVIKKVHKTYYFKKMCHPFKEYVEDLYALRKKYKADGNKMEQVVKLLMNSLYGKFGQKFVGKDNWIPFNHTLEELDKLDNFERIGDFIRVKQEQSDPSAFCFPIWALYTTAYARIKMHYAMLECNPVYVDTDSLVTTKTMDESLELGDLKKEMTISFGLVVKPKFYAFRDSEDHDYVKIKGVGKRLTMMEFNGVVLNPKVFYKKFMKFKESIRRGFIPNEIMDMEKELSLEDNKRVWSECFNPLQLQDSFPVEVVTIDEESMTIDVYNEKLLKAEEVHDRKMEKQQELYFKSDLFDSHAVGSDISNKEFFENETDIYDET